MSVEDRDWYREDFKRKEKEYGGDFSLHSKPKHQTETKSIIRDNILVVILSVVLIAITIGIYDSPRTTSIIFNILFIILECDIFRNTYRKSKAVGNKYISSMIALLACGFSIIATGTSILTVLVNTHT